MTSLEICITIIVPLLALLVGLVWFILHVFNVRYYRYFNGKNNTIRSIVVNREKREVRFFDHNNMRKKRTVSMEQYLNQFSAEDAARFEHWLSTITKKTNKIADDLEIEVKFRNGRRRFYTVMHVTHVDKDNKEVFIDSYLFYNLSVNSRMAYQLRNFTPDERIKRSKIILGSRGYTINVRFSSLNKNGTADNLSRLMFLKLEDIIAESVSWPQKSMLETGDNEVTVFDLKASEKSSSTEYVHSLSSAIRRYLEVSGVQNQVTISFGVVFNTYSHMNVRKIIDKARDMSKIASSKNVLMITYSKDMKEGSEIDKFDSEISEVIKQKKISCQFQAVNDVRKGEVMGYISIPIPVHANAKNILELYNNAVKTGEKDDLLKALVKDVTQAYVSQAQRKESILFRTIRFSDTNVFLNLLRSGVSKDIKSCVCFDEFDISYYATKNKEFFDENINKYKLKKIKLGLILADKSLVLDHKVYQSFDYFFISVGDRKFRHNDSISLEIRTIIERLMKYNRPIILTDVEGWANVELTVRSGIDYLVSSTLAPLSNKLLEPNGKTVSKIQRMIR